jgi:hypothetical protein
MKNVLLLLIFALISLNNNQAQEVGIRFGAKAGINLANLGFDDPDVTDNKVRTCFHAGVLAEIPLLPNLAIQPEVIYSEQGAKYEGDALTKLHYLNVPILAKYYFFEGFNVEAGPQIGFNLTAKEESGGYEIDMKDEVSSIDIGLNVGISYQLKMGIFFQGRCTLGFSNINDGIDKEECKYHHDIGQISVGYKF